MAMINEHGYTFDKIKEEEIKNIKEGDVFAYPIAWLKVKYSDELKLSVKDTYTKTDGLIELPEPVDYEDRNITVGMGNFSWIKKDENKKMSEQLCLIEYRKDEKTGKLYPFELFTQQRLDSAYRNEDFSVAGKSNEEIEQAIEKPYIEVEHLIKPTKEVSEYFKTESTDKKAIQDAIKKLIEKRKENAYKCVYTLAKKRPDYINPEAKSYFGKIVDPTYEEKEIELETMIEEEQEEKKNDGFLQSLVSDLNSGEDNYSK